MTFHLLHNGPTITHIGSFLSFNADPQIEDINSGEQLKIPIYFDRQNRVCHTQQNCDSENIDIKKLRKLSGLMRARSASISTLLAAGLIKSMSELVDYDSESLGIAICSTSSTPLISFNYEKRGLDEGWDLVDPLKLPNTIPSAISTQCAMVVKANAFAMCFTEGLLGFFHALISSFLEIQSNNAQSVFVVGTEETSFIQSKAMKICNRKVKIPDGAAGIFMTSNKKNGYKLSLFGHGVGSPPWELLPTDWHNVNRYNIYSKNPAVLHSYTPIIRISEAFSNREPKFLLNGFVDNLGWSSVGFEQIP